MSGPSHILDASVALSWCLGEEPASTFTPSLGELLKQAAFVPPIWPLEISNVLLVAKRRGRISQEQLADAVLQLSTLPIQVKQSPFPGLIPRDLIEVAERYGITPYGASYLALAMREHLPLATLDKKLRAAAEMAGVKTLGQQG